jgi:hypothetical protein
MPASQGTSAVLVSEATLTVAETKARAPKTSRVLIAASRHEGAAGKRTRRARSLARRDSVRGWCGRCQEPSKNVGGCPSKNVGRRALFRLGWGARRSVRGARRGGQALARLTYGDWPSSATVTDLYGSWAAAHGDARRARRSEPQSLRRRVAHGADPEAVHGEQGRVVFTSSTTNGRAPTPRLVGDDLACRPCLIAVHRGRLRVRAASRAW